MARGLPILGVDFDGVLHLYTSGWRGATVVSDGPTPGAVAFLVEATRVFRVCIYSSRSSEPGGVAAMSTAVRGWLIDEAPDDAERVYGLLEFPTSKPPALVSIDDRAVTFTGTFPSPATLAGFKPWNAKPKD